MVITKNSKASATGAARPCLLVDASIYIFRAYFSLPPNWQSKSGYSTEAVYGFSNFLLDLLLSHPSHLAGICFDESLETGFRHRIYPGYKASRALPDEDLAFQLAACQEMSKALGLASFASEEFEADDLIGSLLAAVTASSEAPVIILTRDKDLGQLLLREQDCLWDFAADKKSYRGDVFAKFGVWPEQLADYLSLTGDSSDDIPGVAGIGAKTAAAILQAHDLNTLLAAPELAANLVARGARTLPEKLREHHLQIPMAKQLATIVCNIPLITSAELLVPAAFNFDFVEELLQQFGIGGLRKKLVRLAKQQEQIV